MPISSPSTVTLECVMKILVIIVLMAGLGSVSGENFTMDSLSGTQPTKENTKIPKKERTRRFIDASEAPEGKFPFMVMAFLYTNICSATLIKPAWTLSSAYCIPNDYPDISYFLIIGGKVDLLDYYIDRGKKAFSRGNVTGYGVRERHLINVFIHPAYNSETKEHNVALLEMEAPLVPPFVSPIPLSLEKLEKPKICTILSFYYKTNEYARLQYIENIEADPSSQDCRDNDFICVSSNKTKGVVCYYDRGVPLVCDGKLWAVIAKFFTPDRCATSSVGLFSPLHGDLNWILGLSGSRRRAASLIGVLASAGGAWFVTVALELFDFFTIRKK